MALTLCVWAIAYVVAGGADVRDAHADLPGVRLWYHDSVLEFIGKR